MLHGFSSTLLVGHSARLCGGVSVSAPRAGPGGWQHRVHLHPAARAEPLQPQRLPEHRRQWSQNDQQHAGR